VPGDLKSLVVVIAVAVVIVIVVIVVVIVVIIVRRGRMRRTWGPRIHVIYATLRFPHSPENWLVDLSMYDKSVKCPE
jgi:hypothetical protein